MPDDRSPVRGMLRIATAGSVDDGKSTLIGRLLYDSKSVFEDQLSAVERSTRKRGGEGIDLSLLTDGLIAEREQGITIDVAYRYFATARRKFIIADSPGHEQYTRNMVTGASTADLAILLIDARKGLLVQSRRHALIASLLGLQHVEVAVNKMDLVDYQESVFRSIEQEFRTFLGHIGITDARFIPVSALDGDNVVDPSEHMPWYTGLPLLELLESVDTDSSRAAGAPLRFPVQQCHRPRAPAQADFRGYMGRIESGTVRPGDAVVVQPSGLRTRVKDILVWQTDAMHSLPSAMAGDSVTLVLADECDISRGDMIAAQTAPATNAREFDALLCWMDSEALDPGRKYLLKHTTRNVPARVHSITSRIDVNSGNEVPTQSLELNDMARVRLQVQLPLALDRYADNRVTGSFILIDEASNHTVAAGMIGR